jgi:hypothetical protein
MGFKHTMGVDDDIWDAAVRMSGLSNPASRIREDLRRLYGPMMYGGHAPPEVEQREEALIFQEYEASTPEEEEPVEDSGIHLTTTEWQIVNAFVEYGVTLVKPPVTAPARSNSPHAYCFIDNLLNAKTGQKTESLRGQSIQFIRVKESNGQERNRPINPRWTASIKRIHEYLNQSDD